MKTWKLGDDCTFTKNGDEHFGQVAEIRRMNGPPDVGSAVVKTSTGRSITVPLEELKELPGKESDAEN